MNPTSLLQFPTVQSVGKEQCFETMCSGKVLHSSLYRVFECGRHCKGPSCTGEVPYVADHGIGSLKELYKAIQGPLKGYIKQHRAFEGHVRLCRAL